MTAENIADYSIFLPENIDINITSKQIQSKIEKLCEGYIWQKQRCEVSLSEIAITGLHNLTGSTNVGENISDEWFIVYIMFEISKQFPQAVIKINDTDGDFLLIEAADYIPKWLQPSTSNNRIFINNGQLHIIPIPSSPAEVTLYPVGDVSIQQAYQTIIGNASTAANQKVQEAIKKKIEGYPEKFKMEFHNAHCYIPQELSVILQNHPHLIAPAVQAFYERDPQDIKLCQKIEHFTAENRRLSSVKFTRHLYCQLMQSQFHPDRKSGWLMKPTKDVSKKSIDLGYKLTCGFEILCCSGFSKSGEAKQEMDIDIPYRKIWDTYLSNLKKSGYFKGELEGSKLYKELLSQAKEHFSQSHSSIAQISSNPVANQVLELVKKAKSMNDAAASSPILPPEDSDDWMELSPEELDQMMLNAWGQGYAGGEEKVHSNNLNNIVSGMKSFVDNVSSYEGAEIPGDETASKDDISFDPEAFLMHFKSALNLPDVSDFNLYKHDDDYSDFYDSDDDSDDKGGVKSSCQKEQFKEGDEDFIRISKQLEDELKETSMGRTFSSSQNGAANSQDRSEDYQNLLGENLDVDLNLVKNFLESFACQDGLSGPVSNILHSMGMNLPPESGT